MTDLPDRAFRLANEFELSALETKIFLKLWQGPATLREIADAMYSDREDGGPLSADECARQIFYRLRNKLGHRATFRPRHEFVMELHRGQG